MIQEWDVIIDWIGENSSSEYGRRSLHEQTVLSKEDARKEFRMINEAGSIRDSSTAGFNFRLDSVSSVYDIFENNEPLEAKHFRVIGDFLTSIRKAGEEIRKTKWYPHIESLFPAEFNISFEMTLKQSVTEKGEVSSNATPELAKIRKTLSDTHRHIGDEIKKMILSPEYSSYLQEDWFTVRDDRYVLPFKSVHKRAMKGVIHNYSRTGQTAFLEPLPLIDHNNRLSLLASKELEEVIKVLRHLRGLLHRNSDYLKKCIECGLHLENLDTKYKWMKKFKTVIPEFSDSGVNIKNGWYPPVFLTAGSGLVKNDFLFKEDEKIMVISGPNAGGKTVSLKTVATVSHLAQRGFPVPAEKAEIPYFENIFIIQGDNQSAVSGESSFSSHLKQLAATASVLDRSSLVLIDEIGTGTDPLQGGAIARAYLEFIAEKGCMAIVTSHLAEVKSIALENRHFVPVAMGFDDKNDKPTYKFSYNIVGGSNALSLVKKIGFPKEFQVKLEKLLFAKENNIEPLINRLRKKEEELETLRLEAEEMKKTAHEEMENANMLKESLEKKEKHFEAQRLSSLKKLMEMEEKELQKKVSAVKDKEAAKKIAVVRKEKETLQEAINRQISVLDEKKGMELKNVLDTVIFGKSVVYDKLLKIEGVLKSVKGKRVDYSSGGKSLSAPVERMIVLEIEKEIKTGASKNPVSSKYAERCDVRGLFTEDARQIIEKALDTAYGGGATSLTIVHGQGSGKLKKFIRNMLEPLRTRYGFSFDPGSDEEGGDSVTVVKFK